jgi:ferredoxin
MTRTRLRVDPTLCSGHGVCAELLAEHISLDEWGYPIIVDSDVPSNLLRDAKRAVSNCPALALRLDAAAGAATAAATTATAVTTAGTR